MASPRGLDDPEALGALLASPEALRIPELARQARTLRDKRFREVCKLFPEAERRRPEFDAYVETFWPSGHDRHRRDAEAFQAFLGRRRGLRLGRWFFYLGLE